MKYKENDGQETVMTVWDDGTFSRWGAADAELAKGSKGYVITFSYDEIFKKTPE